MPRGNVDSGIGFPMTKMNFVVTAGEASAAFSEVSGVEASVDVVEFRQGNSNSLAPIKLPGLVKHGNVTLKFGCTLNNEFMKWVAGCISETRKASESVRNVIIELIDISETAPSEVVKTASGSTIWTLKNAWVTKYSGPDLNATANEVAIESVEIAYEELAVPGGAAGE